MANPPTRPLLHLLFASGLIRFRNWALTMLADVLETTRGVEARTTMHLRPNNGQPMCG
jgi:hypothetical protein